MRRLDKLMHVISYPNFTNCLSQLKKTLHTVSCIQSTIIYIVLLGNLRRLANVLLYLILLALSKDYRFTSSVRLPNDRIFDGHERGPITSLRALTTVEWEE